MLPRLQAGRPLGATKPRITPTAGAKAGAEAGKKSGKKTGVRG